MAVEEVHVPKRKSVIDPKGVGEKDEKDDVAYWDEKKKAARARREFLEEVKAVEDLEKPKEKETVKTGFNVTGEVNLGKLNLQEQMEKAQAERDKLENEKNQQMKELGYINDQLRDKLHDAEVNMLKVSFEQKLDTISKALESQKTNQKGFTEMYQEAMETAKMLGLNQAPGAASAELQLQLKKIEFDQQIMLRKLAREEKESDRRWQLEMQRLQDEREVKKAELAQQQKRDETFARAPELVGRAFGRAVLEGGGDMQEAPQAARKGYHIEAGKGESGIARCPNQECGSEIAIGSTARSAVCSSCGLKIPVKRVEKSPEPSEEEVPEE